MGPHIILDWNSASFLFNLIIKFLAYFTPIDILQKFFISSILLILLVGSKKLIEETIRLTTDNAQEPRHWLVFILSLFTVFNPFVYDRIMYGQFGIVAALGFLILSLGNIFAYLRTKSIKNMVWFGVFAGFMALSSVHFIAFLFLLTILLLTYGLIKKQVSGKILLKHLALALIIILVLNINWILGLKNPDSRLGNFIKKGVTNKELIAFQTSGKTNGEVITNVLMMSGFWGKDQMRYSDLTQSESNWQRSFFFLLPIILVGLTISFKNKHSRFLSGGFVILFIIACTLAIGVRLPISREITQLLHYYLPPYVAFREPQKWVAVIVVIYLFYLTTGAHYLLIKRIIKKNELLSGIILSSIIILQAPLLLLGLNGQVTPTEYPEDWHEINRYITLNQPSNERGCNGNILFLPWHLYMSFNWIGNVVANPTPKFFTCLVISGTNMEWGGIDNDSPDVKSTLVSEWIKKQGNTDLLSPKTLNITYLILAKEVDWQKYLWIETLPSLTLVMETPSLKLYQVNSP